MLRNKKKKQASPVSSPEPSESLTDDQKKTRKMQKLAKRWGGHIGIFDDGFVPLPRTFLKYTSKMKPHSLTPAESLFVINLMYHKWDAASPYPSYKTLAGRMGISVQYARDIARALETKGYLKRQVRVGQTNRFDLNPMFVALDKHIQDQRILEIAP